MSQFLRIGTATVRQVPFSFKENAARIFRVASQAITEHQLDVLLFPELSLSGYGCEDNFTYPDFCQSVQAAFDVLQKDITELLLHHQSNMVVAVGLPLMYPGGQVFNATALISQEGLHGFSCKQFLARNGLHYEPRWFSAWPRGKMTIHPAYNVPMGDIVFDCNGVRLGFETCEDSWVSDRPGRDLYQRNVDVILNPSASHFAVGKYKTRQQFVKEGSRAFGVVYAYANLSGTENGTSIFDGGCMIASDGEIVSAGNWLTLKECALNYASVDISTNRASRAVNSEFIHNHCDNTVPIYSTRWGEDATGVISLSGEQHFPSLPMWEQLSGQDLQFSEICYAVANGLWDWTRKTKTNGFVISLSGGADSALAAVFVELTHRLAISDLGAKQYCETIGIHPEIEDPVALLKFVMKKSLTCAYQGTAQSSSITLNAATKLAMGLNATFHNLDIESQVKGYVELFNIANHAEPLNWQRDDIALQNIQARTRSPSIWLFANRENKLLISTSNLSEAALGYATMDGDTSGVISPLSGISKTTIRKMNKWLEQLGLPMTCGERSRYESLAPVNAQIPTAELRPEEQSDEIDLMPYEICDFIMHCYLVKKMWPRNILLTLIRNGYTHQHTPLALATYVEKWFKLFCRNAWKRYGTRAGFHLEQVSLDPKTFHRFPLLNNGFEEQLQDMWDTYRKITQ